MADSQAAFTLSMPTVMPREGFAFFQKFLKEGGILEELEKAGIQEGDTVRMYGFDFDYYK